MILILVAWRNPFQIPNKENHMDLDWKSIAAIGGTLCTVIGLVWSFYGYIHKLKENSLNGKIDAHFEMQKETLGRVDRNMDLTTQVLERHMSMLTDHGNRLAIAETEIKFLKEPWRTVKPNGTTAQQ